MSSSPTRAVVLAAVREVLAALDPAALVARALPRRPAAGTEVHVVAIGKAAPAMARGVISQWGDAITRCLVVAPKGSARDVARARRAVASAARAAGITSRVTLLEASHPLPDASSVVAGRRCLAAARASAGAPRAVTLFLISGGASALACVPAPGVSLAEKRAATRSLLASGATIQEINAARTALSSIKGGGLARAARGTRRLTLVVGDVIGGGVEDVGSGPSILGRKGEARMLASPEVFADRVARALRRLTDRALCNVRVLPASQAPAEELVDDYTRRALQDVSRATIFVRAAEPSLVVPSRSGSGGRASHVAASFAERLARHAAARDPRARPRVIFAAIATDGVDGDGATAGAVVDARTASRAERRLGRGALERSLRRFDTGTLLRSLGLALRAAPTGHNLTDLHVLVVFPRA